jgi:VanZ family protein
VRLLVFWMIIIFSLSAIPDLKILYWKHWMEMEHQLFISDVDWKLVLSFNNPFFTIPPKDYLTSLDTLLHKIGHLIFYGVLGLLAFRYARTVKKAFWICLAYALFDELHQAITPGRYARLTDLLIDIVAALAGIFIFSRFVKPVPHAAHKETRSAR